ncbi:MAG TPA: DUF4328 domain-containing protein [Chitinophagaceae bacterium]
MTLLKDNTSRAKQIISIFWIMLGVVIVNLAALAWRYILLTDVKSDPDNIDINTINISDKLVIFAGIVDFIIIILSIIFFIMWFRRAYYNLHQLPWHNARHTEGWAAGSWFVPVVWWWWPYQIMMDIWKGTQYAVKERLGNPQSASIVGWWWALHIITSIYDNISTRIGWNAEENLDSLITSTKVDFVGEILTIPAILITVALIQRTSVFEKELLAHAETPGDSIFSDSYVPPAQVPEPKLEN